MLRMLFFLLVVLVANQTYGQGLDIEAVLQAVDPGDRKNAVDDLLNEESGSEFDPMDELDKIPRIRKDKEIAEKEKEIATYDAHMQSECWCVFHSCPYLEVELPDDLSAEAKRLAEQRVYAYNERAKAKEAACRRWKDGGINSDTLYQQLEALKAQSAEERMIEEQLKRQRIADKNRKREAQIAATEAAAAAQAAERERLRQRAESERREREAEQLAWCREAWSRGNRPCECAPLPGAPVCVGPGCTCGK